MMGAVARTVQEGGGKVHGVIPKSLAPREVSGTCIGETTIVRTMHERKALMASQSDAFIALPGGYGTFEELLEVTTWSQLGIHKKPVVAFNINGYYSHLKSLIEHASSSGFVGEERSTLISFPETIDELWDALENYNLRDGIIKWLEEDQV